MMHQDDKRRSTSAAAPIGRRQALAALGAIGALPLLAGFGCDDRSGGGGTGGSRSSNANLSALSLSSGTLAPSFDPETVSYATTVPNSVTTINVTAAAAHPRAQVLVNGAPIASGATFGPINLAPGPNVINVIVVAEDGNSARTYALAITRSATA